MSSKGEMFDLHKRIAANMKRRRLEIGMTLQEVADAAKTSKSHVWTLEQGRNPNPTISMVLALCGALRISLNDLLGMDVARPNFTNQELALIAAHRSIFGEPHEQE